MIIHRLLANGKAHCGEPEPFAMTFIQGEVTCEKCQEAYEQWIEEERQKRRVEKRVKEFC